MIVYRSNIIKAVDGTQWRIDVDDVHYNGNSGILAFQTSAEGFHLKFEGDGSGLYDGFIRASSIDVLIEVNPSVDGYSTGIDTWLHNIIYADEQRYTILLYKDNNLEGVYPVLQDLGTFDDTFPYTFTLSGSDGLGRLKDIDFNPASLTVTSGNALIGDVILGALSNTGVNLFYGINDPYIQSSINWYEVSSDKSDSVLVKGRIPITCLYDDAEKLTYKNCYDVITAMLQPFGATIRMCKGGWWISQPDNYITTSTFEVYQYGNQPFSNGYIGGLSYTPKLVEDTTGATKFRRLSGGSMVMKPAMQYVHVNYKSTSKYLFQKSNYDSYPLSGTYIAEPSLNSFNSLLSVHLTYEVKKAHVVGLFGIVENGMIQSGFARFECVIEAIVASGQNMYLTINTADSTKTPYWTVTPMSIWYDIPKVTDASDQQIVDFDLNIPAVPNSTVTGLDFVSILCHEIDSICGADLKWSANFKLSQLNSAGKDNLDQQYQATNPSFPSPMPCTSVDLSTNTITLNAHGFINGQQLRIVESGSTGLIQNSLLFVVGATINDFQLSLTSGGSVLALGGTSTVAPTVQKYDSSTQRLASVKQVFENLIGDNDQAFSDSAIEIYTGSVWQRSSTWNVGTTATTGYNLGQLLSIRALLMQKTPRMCYQGNLKYGTNLFPSNSIYMMGKLFIFNSSVYNANTSSVQIEYIECQLDSDLTTSIVPPNRGFINSLNDILTQVKNLNQAVGGIQGQVAAHGTAIDVLVQNAQNSQPSITTYLPNLPTSPTSGQQVSVDVQFNDALGVWELTAHH